MRKVSVFFAVFALVGASCTKIQIADSGDSSPSKGAISLSAYTAMPTKAAQTDVITDDFTSFQVSAIGNGAKYFDNVTFTKNSEGVWASSPAYFWPVYALDFYAYNTPADGNGTFSRNITTSSPQTLKYSPSAELAKQEDLVVAYATSKTENNATSTSNSLALTFNHYLTQVVVNALCSNSNYTVVVDGVKLANMAGEGTYTFSTKQMVATTGLVNSSTSSDYSSTFTAKTLEANAKEVMADATGKWYLIPQTVTAWKRDKNESAESATNEMKNTSNGTYLALKVKITSKGGSNVYPYSGSKTAWMAVPVPAELAFAQGKKYNVTIKFFGEDGKGGAGYVDPEDPGELDGDTSTKDNGKKIIGGAIKFDATVSPWGDAVDITISL